MQISTARTIDQVLGENRVDSQAEYLRRQEHQEREAWLRRQHQAGIPKRGRRAELDHFIIDTPEQAEIQGIGRVFVETAGTSKPTNLLLLGGVGTGKTFFGCGIANGVLQQKRFTVRYDTVFGFLRHLRSSWHSREETEAQVFNGFVKTHLLVLDEVGASGYSPSDQAQLIALLDARYENHKPTVLIGNVTIAELTHLLSARIVDRLKQGGQVLVFDWKSRRESIPDQDFDEPHIYKLVM